MHLIYNKQKLNATEEEMRSFAFQLFASDIIKGSKNFYYVNNGIEPELCRPCESDGENSGFDTVYMERDYIDGELVEVRVRHLTNKNEIVKHIQVLASKTFLPAK